MSAVRHDSMPPRLTRMREVCWIVHRSQSQNIVFRKNYGCSKQPLEATSSLDRASTILGIGSNGGELAVLPHYQSLQMPALA